MKAPLRFLVGRLRSFNKEDTMNRLWKNWTVHNLVSHPLSEIVHWFTSWKYGSEVSGWIHDVTIPEDTHEGRG